MRAVPRTMVHQLHSQAERLADRPALWTKRSGTWVPTSWRDYARRVRQREAPLGGRVDEAPRVRAVQERVLVLLREQQHREQEQGVWEREGAVCDRHRDVAPRWGPACRAAGRRLRSSVGREAQDDA